jgi:hypothetical protein
MLAGTQRYSRTKMVLPLRLWLDEGTSETLSMQWIHTIDISQVGCRLGGLRTSLSPGHTIALQRGQQKASFRVIWSKHLEAEEHQAGIEALDYGRNIWAKELPLSPIAEDSIEPTWDSEDFSAVASTASMTDGFIPVEAHPRIHWGLGFGLLLVALALGLSLYTGIFYAWGLVIGLLLLGAALVLRLHQG